MITAKQLKIYASYKGDVDKWAQTGKSKERLIISTDDWYLIDSLLQDVEIMNNGQASSTFISKIEVKLLELCENEETINLLKAMVNLGK